MTPAIMSFLALVISLLILEVQGLEEGDIDGSVGPGRLFALGTYDWTGMHSVAANTRECCCDECKTVFSGTKLVDFIKRDTSQCRCYKLLNGVRPATQPADENHLSERNPWDPDFSDPVYSSGVCGLVSCGGHNARSCQQCGSSHSYCNGDCKWQAGKCVNRECGKYQSGNPEALALTQPLAEKSCHGAGDGIPCCPELRTGDNNGAKGEHFVEEADYHQEGCATSCKKLYQRSTGITESLTENYTKGGKKCWCEMGAPVFAENKNYQTCMF